MAEAAPSTAEVRTAVAASAKASTTTPLAGAGAVEGAIKTPEPGRAQWGTPEPVAPLQEKPTWQSTPEPPGTTGAKAEQHSAAPIQPQVEATTNAQNENLSIADRLTSARSIRDVAEQALDSYAGTDLNEYKALEQNFRKAESSYRDLQAESDRSLTEQRLISTNEQIARLLQANTELRQTVENMGKNFGAEIKRIMEYIDEKDPDKKKNLKKLILEIAALLLLGVGTETMGEMKGAVEDQTNQRR